MNSNPFIQHIGIWYSYEDKETCLSIMNKLDKWLDEYKNYSISSKYEYSIFLKDGTWIKAIPINTSQRGQRCSTSFVLNPNNCDNDLICSTVKRCTTYGCGDICSLIWDDSKEDSELWREFNFRRRI